MPTNIVSVDKQIWGRGMLSVRIKWQGFDSCAVNSANKYYEKKI